MNSLTRILSYDKTKINQENCNCKECVSVENANLKNQTVEYPPLSEEEIEQIIKERYDYKDEKTKTFIKKALRKHGDRYDYSNVIYVKSDEKVEIICRVKGHKPFPQTPYRHSIGHGCQKCANEKIAYNKRLTINEFIEKARKIHDNKYDYSKVNYINAFTYVTITCPIHGDFPQTPNDHLNGAGCRKCAFEKQTMRQRKSLNKFIKESRKVHGNKYDYSKVNYINTDTEVIITCPIHGDFPQTPYIHHISRKQGCSKCKSSKGETIIRNFLIKHNIEFEEQKRFKDCKDKRPLPFDFYIPQYNLCIEYDGKQHFVPYDFAYKMTEEQKLKNFNYIQSHDQIKNNYCKSHNINLLRIKYDENTEEKLTKWFQNHKLYEN